MSNLSQFLTIPPSPRTRPALPQSPPSQPLPPPKNSSKPVCYIFPRKVLYNRKKSFFLILSSTILFKGWEMWKKVLLVVFYARKCIPSLYPSPPSQPQKVQLRTNFEWENECCAHKLRIRQEGVKNLQCRFFPPSPPHVVSVSTALQIPLSPSIIYQKHTTWGHILKKFFWY